MYTPKLCCIFLAVLAMTISCSDDDLLGPLDDGYVYPLTVGNRWEYNSTFEVVNVRGDSSDFLPDSVVTSMSRLDITGTIALFDSVDVLVFSEKYFSEGTAFAGESYFNNRDDGLYLYGTTGNTFPAVRPAKKAPVAGIRPYALGGPVSFAGGLLLQSSSQDDTVIVENPPVRSLAYPLSIGLSWPYRDGPVGEITKRVVEEVDIEVPAGKFDCVKIQWIFEIEQDIEFYDYIAAEGLVLRTVRVKDMIATDPSNPDGTGVIFDALETHQLTSVRLR